MLTCSHSLFCAYTGLDGKSFTLVLPIFLMFLLQMGTTTTMIAKVLLNEKGSHEQQPTTMDGLQFCGDEIIFHVPKVFFIVFTARVIRSLGLPPTWLPKQPYSDAGNIILFIKFAKSYYTVIVILLIFLLKKFYRCILTIFIFPSAVFSGIYLLFIFNYHPLAYFQRIHLLCSTFQLRFCATLTFIRLFLPEK